MGAPPHDSSAEEAGPTDEHIPVLRDEVLEYLVTDTAGLYVDATYGRGGHSSAVLQLLSGEGRLLAFDRDGDAVKAGEANQDRRLTVAHGRFSQLGSLLAAAGVEASKSVDGVLMDIGVSSPQLDTASRGFSFMLDGPLDMRMDTSNGVSASDWLSEVSEEELTAVLKTHGEERFARRIARAILKSLPITTTAELADVVAGAVPAAVRHRAGKHPATQTFQAIRIHLNGEDQELDEGLEQSFEALKPGGRLAVISFHSLEDRVVKRRFKRWSTPPELPRRLPVKHVEQKVAARIVAGPIKASSRELQMNPRARSAVLRVVEKCHE